MNTIKLQSIAESNSAHNDGTTDTIAALRNSIKTNKDNATKLFEDTKADINPVNWNANNTGQKNISYSMRVEPKAKPEPIVGRFTAEVVKRWR